MTSPIDEDDDKLINGAEEGAGGDDSEEGKSGKSGSGKQGKAGDTDKGEGDSDSFGRGKAGAGAGMSAIRVPAEKMKEIMSVWRRLGGDELIQSIVEFFAEAPMRASANAVVQFVKDVGKEANAKSFALVNWVIEFGNKSVREFVKTRERERARERSSGTTRDSRGLQSRTQQNPAKPTKSATSKPKTPGADMNLGPKGPNG